ncbi:MAG: hypothetical protein KF794_10515 [Xanthobacteraceae bacterium]|nr:hypothetical protein [Xanthobacteraceae bacterium]QYK44217.1 MAG: hypothetical protein KF794_10515 [Xanthobacteraceae bacterium]
MRYPVTPDGRYFVVRGRLWRMTDPSLSAEKRTLLMRALMNARREVRDAMQTKNGELEKEARRRVHKAKIKLGERGEPWWTDGAPDYNQHLAKNTPYKDWFAALA